MDWFLFYGQIKILRYLDSSKKDSICHKDDDTLHRIGLGTHLCKLLTGPCQNIKILNFRGNGFFLASKDHHFLAL